MFQAVSRRDRSELLRLGKAFHRAGNSPAALLCLDHYFVNPPHIKVTKGSETLDALHAYLVYVRLLRHVAVEQDPCHQTAFQKLFGFRFSTESFVLVPRGTFLFTLLENISPGASWKMTEEGVFIPDYELKQHFQTGMKGRLRSRIQEENQICLGAHAFTPCISYAALATCRRGDCPQEHLLPSEQTPEAYNIRIQLHLQQLHILATLASVEPSEGLRYEPR